MTSFVRASMPLCEVLGIEGVSSSADEVVLELGYDERLTTAGGLLHGGAVMALADASGALCAYLNLPEGASGTATIESKTNFLGAVRSGTVRARSVPLHVDSTTIVVETEIRLEDRLVAKTTQTQAVIRPAPAP
ncbi:MAG: PaaI family thioesterase [Acidimicrobiales bacterium]|nr:PaaI family thioesterase [Acidimicrobiales bacterium]